MGILDDFGNAVSGLWNDGVEAFENLVEMGEEAVEEAGELILDEILGLDDLTSGEGSDEGSASEGHEEHQDWGLQIADLEDAIVTSVEDARYEADINHLLWADDIHGTVDDIVTTRDATHVFDDVTGSVEDGLAAIDAEDRDDVATELQDADTTADTLRFLNQGQATTPAPDWTDSPVRDPHAGILELPDYLASDILTESGDQPQSRSDADPDGSSGTSYATTLDDASSTLSANWLF